MNCAVKPERFTVSSFLLFLFVFLSFVCYCIAGAGYIHGYTRRDQNDYRLY